jgi:hypothetical protein
MPFISGIHLTTMTAHLSTAAIAVCLPFFFRTHSHKYMHSASRTLSYGRMRKASRIDRLTESIADTSFINRLHDQLVLPITHQRYSWLLLFLLLLLVVVAQFSQKCGRFCAHFPINLRKEVVVSGRVNERATELQVARGGVNWFRKLWGR